MPINPREAPAGFYATHKPAYRDGLGNICDQCDWRKECNDPKTDLLAFGHRCMAVPVVAFRDGKTYARADGTSVLFKRLPEGTQQLMSEQTNTCRNADEA